MSARKRFFSTTGLLALLALVGAVIVGDAAVRDYQELRVILERGVPAEATVIDVDRRRRSLDEPKVRFVTREGDSIEAWVGLHRWDGDVEMGTTRSVLYDPADPQGGVLDREEGSLYLTHQFSVLAVFVLTLFAVGLWWPEAFQTARAWIVARNEKVRGRRGEKAAR
ncbi:DUF3592 domain-containing protein [Nonomuraea insulae]|uniref:DUF3592 domain-containing protein n=1 Tax=Nonomuraea insulae TaxID=1616787 RepID=A0ABW1CAI1_9ACTN